MPADATDGARWLREWASVGALLDRPSEGAAPPMSSPMAVPLGVLMFYVVYTFAGVRADQPGCHPACTLDFNCTTVPLGVAYSDDLIIKCGTKLKKTNPALAHSPKITLESAKSTAGYTLMMIDPDAPSAAAPRAAPIRHWVVVDIPGAGLAKGDISGGMVASPYHQPGPPPGSGYHRYGQFIFEQPTPQLADFKPFEGSIALWNYTAFINTYALGEKVASNFLLAEA